MSDTFNKGDVLLINRLSFDYEKNDVVYFKFPLKDSTIQKTYCFQRIVAQPGDTLQIIEKTILINGIKLNDTASVKHNYYLKANVKLDSAFIELYGLNEGGEISNDLDYSFSLTETERDSLKSSSRIEKLTLKNEQKDAFDKTVFPYSTLYSWNMDHFGKIYIPKKNDTIALDTINLHLYSPIIRDYEKNMLAVKNDSIFINNVFNNKYVIQQDYYFVMGDNRDNSIDSRVFGYLPKDHIRAKVVKVLKYMPR